MPRFVLWGFEFCSASTLIIGIRFAVKVFKYPKVKKRIDADSAADGGCDVDNGSEKDADDRHRSIRMLD